jgi:hypothetical protein
MNKFKKAVVKKKVFNMLAEHKKRIAALRKAL